MKPKALIVQKVSDHVKSILENHLECEYWEHEYPISRDKLIEMSKDKEGIMLSGHRIDAGFLETAKHLKVVSNVSVGYNNFDTQAMRERGVLGTHTPEVLDDTVADLILALMLATSRRIAELDAYVKSGGWQAGDVESIFGLDVHHKKVGIIGMGRIGEKIAKRCKFGFDMEVSYYNRRQKPEVEKRLNIKYQALNDLLTQSDFVVLMVPLTQETENMMNLDAFEKMKATSIFINGSRGATVVENDLLEAIRSKKIWGAGLDVFVREPIESSHPFLREKRIVTVPHIGSATAETRELMAITAAENLCHALTGKIPKYIVPEHQNL